MINREWKTAQVISFSADTDTFGQPRAQIDRVRDIQVVMKTYKENSVNDARYVDVSNVCLTADKDISDANQIECEGIKYDVLYTIPTNRLNMVLLKKV